jgi:hypothetical protein
MPNTNLLTIVDSYACMPEYKEMKTFFSNDSNAKGIQDAIDKYGMPPANTPSYNTGWGLFKKDWGWHDFCDWQNIGKFFAYAKLSVQYPNLSNSTDQTSCVIAKAAVPALQGLLNNVNSTYTDTNQRTSVNNAIADKIAEYNTFLTKNNCDSYIADKKASDALATSTTTVANTFTTIISKYGVYIIGGAILYFVVKSKKD